MADPRNYLAEERTVLAWIRTGLALMGFGFVVARFGLFLQELRLAQGGVPEQTHVLSPLFGTVLIAVGVTTNLFAAWRHVRLMRAWRSGRSADYQPSREALALAVFLALIGIAIAVHLTSTFTR